jgi:hypothetical protein
MLNLLVSVKGSLTGISGDGHAAAAATASSLAMTSLGIPFTGCPFLVGMWLYRYSV